MGARGGTLDVIGFKSPLISVSEYQRSCMELIKALEAEIGDQCPEMDEEIDVDDLKILSPDQIIDFAMKNTACEPNRADADDVEEPSEKSTPKSDSASRVKLLQVSCLDPEIERKVAKMVEDRNLAKAGATVALSSLQLSDDAWNKKLRSAGPRKFVCSTMGEDRKASVSSDEIEEIAAGSEVLISIDFHGRKGVKAQELLVLGSQSLAEFRDQLYCVIDEVAVKKHMKSPSGYFLIEDIFYNDMRHSDATDYSENIISWIREREQARRLRRKRSKLAKLPDFTKAIMEDTCFRDLKFKLGLEYLYCHQGDCKHVFVFRDLRLIHSDDARSTVAYPLLRFMPRLRHKKCSICSVYRARKITRDDKLAPTNPCLFCESCYYSLHYSTEGILLYDDFSVEDFFHE